MPVQEENASDALRDKSMSVTEPIAPTINRDRPS